MSTSEWITELGEIQDDIDQHDEDCSCTEDEPCGERASLLRAWWVVADQGEPPDDE